MRAVALLLVLSASGAAAAQHTPASYFANADLDRDQRLSLPEYQAWMSYAFRQMDSNGDEVLEPEEQLVPNAPRLTLAELHERLAGQFRRQDTDGDGALSQREFTAPPR